MSLTLYQFPTRWGIPNESPFCMKLETYLRMSGLPFTTVYSFDLTRAPKGKMPYIQDRGKKIGDSNLIIDYLRTHDGVDLDKNFSREETATSLAFRRLIEENLYWCIIHSRWNTESGWKIVEPVFFDFLPPLVRLAVGRYFRRKMILQLNGHGIGRHASEEIFQIAHQDITALADFLGEKPFFMGPSPTSIDASVYGFLGNILWVPLEDPLQKKVKSHLDIVQFCERMRKSYYQQHAVDSASPARLKARS